MLVVDALLPLFCPFWPRALINGSRTNTRRRRFLAAFIIKSGIGTMPVTAVIAAEAAGSEEEAKEVRSSGDVS